MEIKRDYKWRKYQHERYRKKARDRRVWRDHWYISFYYYMSQSEERFNKHLVKSRTWDVIGDIKAATTRQSCSHRYSKNVRRQFNHVKSTATNTIHSKTHAERRVLLSLREQVDDHDLRTNNFSYRNFRR